jgi:hypothetical protein
MGHNFFIEAGDEDFVLIDHNLAVKAISTPLLLQDDTAPAGFWNPGFGNWHRNNLAVKCARGWRAMPTGMGTKQNNFEFFNNAAHLCGFGWHVKPGFGPNQLNTMSNFTAFRCGTGSFYYSTGNLNHEDHRYVECGEGVSINWFNNNFHTPAPIFTDVVLVGNIDDTATFSKMRHGISAPDQDYWFVSGVYAKNMWQSVVLGGCPSGCTMRYEATVFDNSPVRTRHSGRGIFWDLDGSLTGFPHGFVVQDAPYNRFADGVCTSGVKEHAGALVCGRSDGSVRVRLLTMQSMAPWQIYGQPLTVATAAGTGLVGGGQKGWRIAVISGAKSLNCQRA